MTDVVTSDGVRLYAEATGSGLPVLFIHEFAADHRTWSRQVDALSGTFRCITYASRGYPPSEVPPEQERYNYLRQADDAIDVLDAFGIARAHVVGLSMGGFCALQLGIRYPDRVASLLVASAGSGASPRGRAAFLSETEQLAAAFLADGMAAVSAKQAMGPNRIQLRRKNRQVWEEFAGQLAEHSAEGMALTVIGIQRSRPSLYDIVDQLANITVPTLVVNGDEDEACLEPGLLLKRTIPMAGLAIVPNSGHALNLEEPALFNDLIRTLIDAAEAGTWPTRDPRSLSASMGIASAVRAPDAEPRDTAWVTVPSLIALTVSEARSKGQHSGVVVTSADADGPPLGALTWPGTWIVTAQRPIAGARVARWSLVAIEFKERLGGPGDVARQPFG